MSVTVTTKVAKIFEYLLAVKNLDERTIYNITEYDKHWWEVELPDLEELP